MRVATSPPAVVAAALEVPACNSGPGSFWAVGQRHVDPGGLLGSGPGGWDNCLQRRGGARPTRRSACPSSLPTETACQRERYRSRQHPADYPDTTEHSRWAARRRGRGSPRRNSATWYAPPRRPERARCRAPQPPTWPGMPSFRLEQASGTKHLLDFAGKLQPYPQAGETPRPGAAGPPRPVTPPTGRPALFLEELLHRLTGQVRARRGTVRRFPGHGAGERGRHHSRVWSAPERPADRQTPGVGGPGRPGRAAGEVAQEPVTICPGRRGRAAGHHGDAADLLPGVRI